MTFARKSAYMYPMHTPPHPFVVNQRVHMPVRPSWPVYVSQVARKAKDERKSK